MNSAGAIVLANIPSPDRGVWELGPIPIRAYALCILAGIVVAIWWGERRWVQRGGTQGTILDLAVWAVPFGIVGGRLYHVITDYQRYFGEGRNPLEAFNILNGGLGIWGAIALGGVGVWIGCRRKGIPLPAVADAIAPGIVTAQAIGRLGNYFNQELYGAPTDLPWGLEIYCRTSPDYPAAACSLSNPGPVDGVATGQLLGVVHPTFLYELLWNLGVALLVVWADRRFRLGHGRAFAVYVAGYTAGRFWIELMRTDEATHVLGLRVNVWTSILVFAGAIVYLVLAARRGAREAPETLRSDDAATPEEAAEAGAPESRDSIDNSGPPGATAKDSDRGDIGETAESANGDRPPSS